MPDKLDKKRLQRLGSYINELEFSKEENDLESFAMGDEKNSGDKQTRYDKTPDAIRVGRRIRAVREAVGIPQTYLAKIINDRTNKKYKLTGDRIQKYESGARKPKLDLLKEIANALEVPTEALAEPVLDTDIGVIYGLIEMSDYLSVSPYLSKEGKIFLKFDNGDEGEVNAFLRFWYELLEEYRYNRKNTDAKVAIQADYIVENASKESWIVEDCSPSAEKQSAENQYKLRLLRYKKEFQDSYNSYFNSRLMLYLMMKNNEEGNTFSSVERKKILSDAKREIEDELERVEKELQKESNKE